MILTSKVELPTLPPAGHKVGEAGSGIGEDGEGKGVLELAQGAGSTGLFEVSYQLEQWELRLKTHLSWRRTRRAAPKLSLEVIDARVVIG